jgi:hypothetical protein
LSWGLHPPAGRDRAGAYKKGPGLPAVVEFKAGTFLKEEGDMKAHRTFSLVMACVVLAFGCISCSDDSSSSGSPGGTQEILEPVGSWLGWFKGGDSGSYDVYGFDPTEDTFAAMIIERDGDSPERRARFISDTAQLVCDDFYVGYPTTYLFFGNFDSYTWNNQGPDYSFYEEPVSIYGYAFSNTLLLGEYWETESGSSQDNLDFMFLAYNSTTTGTGVTADVEKLVGEWAIQNAFSNENTLIFTITTTGVSGTGGISGYDGLGNTIEGEIIEIHYEDLPDQQSVDTYRVLVELATSSGTFIDDLEGAATYISNFEVDEGEEIERVLAIGVSGMGHMITGLAAPVVEE